jgi:hypothetical protein
MQRLKYCPVRASRTTHWSIAVALTCVVILGGGCQKGIAVPEGKRSFVGRWENDESFFQLSAEARLDMELLLPTGEHLRVRKARFHRFDNERISIALFPIWAGRSFQISSEPFETDRGVAISVEGITLWRVPGEVMAEESP